MSFGIPDALSFDRIIAGGTCPVSSWTTRLPSSSRWLIVSFQPCTTRDFMNYLIYIEYSAENLQFFLWYRDYVKRFSELLPAERALAPDWAIEQADSETSTSQANATAIGQKPMSQETAAVFKGTDFGPPTASMVELKSSDPFNTPPGTPTPGGGDSIAPSEFGSHDNDPDMRNPGKSFHQKAAGAFTDADLKWQPCGPHTFIFLLR